MVLLVQGIAVSSEGDMVDGEASAQFGLEEVSPAYWRVTFENGPVNLFDADSIEQLASVITRIEDSDLVSVVVFTSANPDHFMAHWDLRADRTRVAAMAPGPTGQHPYVDNLIRLSKVPAATISEIRGRVRGTGSEFALATDVRFASDTAIVGHLEVGVGYVPGGGAMARLARLVGRGRAAEILLGGDDLSAELAERYGYVNRVLPDGGLSAFVDAFARRIAGFDKEAIVATKGLLDLASLPPDDEFRPGYAAFLRSSGRPQVGATVRALFDAGLQQAGDVEIDLGRVIGELSVDRFGAHPPR